MYISLSWRTFYASLGHHSNTDAVLETICLRHLCSSYWTANDGCVHLYVCLFLLWCSEKWGNTSLRCAFERIHRLLWCVLQEKALNSHLKLEFLIFSKVCILQYVNHRESPQELHVSHQYHHLVFLQYHYKYNYCQ